MPGGSGVHESGASEYQASLRRRQIVACLGCGRLLEHGQNAYVVRRSQSRSICLIHIKWISVERIFCECDAPLVGRSICDRTDRVASGSRIDRGEPAKRAAALVSRLTQEHHDLHALWVTLRADLDSAR
jgi:hypothetical protein